MEDDGDDFKFVDEEEDMNQIEHNKMVVSEKNVNVEWDANQQVNQAHESLDENKKPTNENTTNNNHIKSNEHFETTQLPQDNSYFTKEISEKCSIRINKIELEIKEEKDSEEIFNFVDETIRNHELIDIIKEELEFRNETRADEIASNSFHNNDNFELKQDQKIENKGNSDNFDKNNMGQVEFSSEADITNIVVNKNERGDIGVYELHKMEEKHVEIIQAEFIVKIEHIELDKVEEKHTEIIQAELCVKTEHIELNEVEEKLIEIKQEELNVEIKEEKLNEVEEKFIEINEEKLNVVEVKLIEIKQEELNAEIKKEELNEVEEKHKEIRQEELDVEIKNEELNEVEEKLIEIKQEELDVEIKKEELNVNIGQEKLNEDIDLQLESRNHENKENLQSDETEIFTEEKKQEIPINNKHSRLAEEDQENSNLTRTIMHESNYTTDITKSTGIVPTTFPLDEDDITQVENEDKEILIDQIQIAENTTSENHKDLEKEFKNNIQETKDEDDDDDFKDAEETSQPDEINENHEIFNEPLDSKPCQEVINDESISKHSNTEEENIETYNDDFEFNEVAEEQDANHELQYIADSEVKISSEKAEKENTESNLNEDDFDFNEVDEAEPELKIPSEKNENEIKNTESNLNEDDFDFNEVDEADPELKIPIKINQVETRMQEAIIEISENKPHQNKELNEDEDFFDFVEEDDENNQNTKDNENAEKICESPTNNQTNPDIITLKKANESSHSNIRIPNINKQQGKNFDLINKLLTEYKDSYLSSTNFISNSEKFTAFNDTMSNTEITNFYLDIDKNNISMKNIIDVIPSSKFEPEIELKSLTVEEINILSNPSIEEKKIKVISEKELKFKNSISEISSATVKKLYFKYIDLKNIYVNSLQVQTHKNIQDKVTKNPKLIKKEASINNQIDDSEISIGNSKKEVALEFVDAEDQTKNKIIEKNNFPVPLENLQCSTMMIDITEPNKQDADESSDGEEEFEEVEEETNKKAIFIDEVLYSIMMDPNSSSKNELASTNIPIDSNAIENSSNEIKTTDSKQDFDENKMLEYLKTITLTNKSNKENDIIENLIKEEDKNDEMFKKLIDDLPNYNFIISKYVEYPDSLFNI